MSVTGPLQPPAFIDEPTEPQSFLEREVTERADRKDRASELRGTALASEGFATFLVLIASAAFIVLGDIQLDHPWVVLGLAVCFGVTSRISFPISVALAIPTQLFLWPLLMLGPPELVPLIVFVSLAVAASFAALQSGKRPPSVFIDGGNALYSIGPAAVFVLAGAPGTEASALIIVLALASQIGLDATASWLGERSLTGGASRFPVRPYALVWLVDVLLTPIGVIAALAYNRATWAPFALVPLVALFGLAAFERTRRAEEARAQIGTVTRERTRLRAAVHRIGDAFASTLDLDALLTITARAAVEAVDADAARASSTTGLGRKLTHRVTIHEDERTTPLLTAVEDRAVNGQSLAHAIVAGVYAMAAPIGDVDAGGVVAVARNSHEFSAEERQLFSYLCEQASVAARNVARHASLHRQALTDDLTGLANHRRFQELLSDGHDRYRESGTRVGLVLLDIDDFKQVNDRFGHQVGDQVLRNVAGALRDTCRETDEPARYGGEELAVVVSDADMHECSRLAERMRRAIEEVEVVGPADERITVTASFGVALMGELAPDPATLIASADAALYRAKYQGKNCVRLADDGPSGGHPAADFTS